jgi:ribose-phosphate pyrophosphokinase
MLMAAGCNHIITMDLHDPQFQGFFNIPVDNLTSEPLMAAYIRYNIPHYSSCVMVSPDAGGAKRFIFCLFRASKIASKLGMDFALIHKERQMGRGLGRVQYSNILVGNVRDRECILLDDMADTCKTLCKAINTLNGKGVKKVYALITHGLLSGNAIADLKSLAKFDELIVSNTVPQDQNIEDFEGKKLKIFDVAPLFAEAIRRIHNGESVSMLFDSSSW